MEHKLAEFTKKDLRPGDVLTTRIGYVFTVNKSGEVRDDNNASSPFTSISNGVKNNLLNDNLTNEGGMGSDYDIIRIERSQVIWERSKEKTNEELHREMWNWLAENPKRSKMDWLNDNGYIEDKHILNGCFACEECGANCNKCPLDEHVIGCNYGGLYDIWRNTPNIDFKSLLAKVIANLPWKSKEKTK